MKPLEWLRVVGLWRVLGGPWCVHLLADLGAEVVKIERRGGGDDTRQWGPPFVTGEGGEALGAAYYHRCNRGKRSVAIDIATGAGQAELRDLLTGAAVVNETYKAGGVVQYDCVPGGGRAGFPGADVLWFPDTGPAGPLGQARDI